MDTTALLALLTAGGAAIGGIGTFLLQRKDSMTTANVKAVEALSMTIEQLRKQVLHLEEQLHELEVKFKELMVENEALIMELHSHRRLLAEYTNHS